MCVCLCIIKYIAFFLCSLYYKWCRVMHIVSSLIIIMYKLVKSCKKVSSMRKNTKKKIKRLYSSLHTEWIRGRLTATNNFMLEDIEIFMPRHMCQLNNCIVYKIRESLQRKMVLYFENFAGSHEHIIQMGNFSPAALSYVSTACTNYRFVLVSTSYFCVITFCTFVKAEW